MSLDLDYLEPIERAQLLHCRPELRYGFPVCKRCGQGQVVAVPYDPENPEVFFECLQCSVKYDKDEELFTKRPNEEVSKSKGAHHSFKRKITHNSFSRRKVR